MTNKIRNYKDLLFEERRLQQLRNAQGEIIALDADQWKEKLGPVTNVLGVVKKMSVPAGNDSPLSMPLKILVKLIAGHAMPQKSGWLLRWLVPVAVKNYSSYKLNDWGDKLITKAQKWWSKKKKRKHEKQHKSEEEND